MYLHHFTLLFLLMKVQQHPFCYNYFIQLNKMSTLFEDQTSRAERYRKHQLYKNMLDQQIKFKNQYRDSDESYRKMGTPKHHHSINQVTSHNYQNHQNQLDFIRNKQPISEHYPKSSANSPITRLHTNQEEQTQKYLNSCEEIIKNLRQLKQKRKERQMALFRLESDLKTIKQQPQSEQYHPRNSHFSTSVKKSREPFRQSSTPKNKVSYLKPLKTIGPQSRTKFKQNPQSKQEAKNVKVTHKRMKKNQSKDKILEADEQEKEKDKEQQSYQPKGIKEKYSKSKSSKKKSSPRKKNQEIEKDSQQNLRKQLLQSQNAVFKQENNRLNVENKEVYECLMELMKYFKYKNEKTQQERKKTELISEQTQVDITDEREQSGQKNQTQRQNRVSQLKLKALIKLRQLNQKGREFVAKMKGEKEEDQKNHKSKSQQKRSISRNSKIQEPQNYQKFTNNSEHYEDPLRQKSRLSSIQTKIRKEEKENEQLFKAIANQLNRQEVQNQSLTNCLKELSMYLKDQNQQLQAIKNSKVVIVQQPEKLSPQNKEKTRSKSKNSETQSKPQISRAQQFPKPKQSRPKIILEPEKEPVEHTKQEENILKQAFLKKLKKVRLRGKLLNDKIEAYKKQHNPPSADKQTDKLQINPQLSPEQSGQKQQNKGQTLQSTEKKSQNKEEQLQKEKPKEEVVDVSQSQ